jgi:hypothetical protein
MSFKAVWTGGNHCCWWMAAEGEITNETPLEFERFLNSEKCACPAGPIRFDSPGGSLFAALELGTAIRKHGFDTEVGHGWPENFQPTRITFVMILKRAVIRKKQLNTATGT